MNPEREGGKNVLIFREGMSIQNRLIISTAGISLLVFIYIMLSENFLPLFDIHLPSVPYLQGVKILSACLAAFCCLLYFRGVKPIVCAFVFWVFFAWAVEALSIHTGFPAGHYSYTGNFPGPKIWDTPVLLGFQYFAYYFFMSYFLANLLADGVLVSSVKSWWKRSLFVAFISSVIVAGIDMMADPVQVNVFHQWQWPATTPHIGYYGIPYANYAGYIVIFTVFLFIFKYLEIRWDAQPLGPVTIGIAIIPFAMHFSRFVEYSSDAPAGVFLVGCFTMLFPLVLCMDKFVRFFRTGAGTGKGSG